MRSRSDGGGDGARTRRSALTFTARPRSGLSPTQRPPLRPQIRPTCGQRCDRGEAFTNSQQGACKPSAAIGSQGLEAADDPSGHGAPPSPFTPRWKPPTTLRATAPLLRRLLRIRTSSPTSEHAVYSAASGPARLPPNTPFTPPHPDQLAYLRTRRLLRRIRTSSPTSEHTSEQPRRPWRPSSSFVPRGWKPPTTLRATAPLLRRLLRIRTSSPTSEQPRRPWRPSSSFVPSASPSCLRTSTASPPSARMPPAPPGLPRWHATGSASGPARRPPNGLGDHGGRPLRLCPRPAPPACAPQRLHRHRPACLRLRPVRCDWFPGAGSRRRPSGPRHPSFAVYSASRPARRPPNSLGDHGGSARGWKPPTALRATAPLLRRLLRIRTSSPTSEHAYLRTASETMAAVLFICSQGLGAADDPSGHGTPPSPFTPHPDQLADLRTASETMAAVLFICALGRPLVLAHLNGFTAIGPHTSGSAWSATLACNRLRIRTSSPTSEQPRRPWRPSAAIGSQGLEAADDPSGHGTPPSHLNGFTAIGPHASGSAWSATLACNRLRIRTSSPTSEQPRRPWRPSSSFVPSASPSCLRTSTASPPSACMPPAPPGLPRWHATGSASGPARRPPNSLGDHGGRPLHLCPRPAPLACAPQRFHRHRPACLRLRPVRCDWFPGAGSRRRPFGPRHPSFAVYSASRPARRPPNSLRDHGGRPLHLGPRPAPRACAPQRLHRHRPARLRLRLVCHAGMQPAPPGPPCLAKSRRSAQSRSPPPASS